MVGVEGSGNHNLTKSMLDKIIHRGKEAYNIYENNWGSVGIISSKWNHSMHF